MSCYGYERGTVKIPGNQWKATRDAIYSSYNYEINQALNKALFLYNEIKKEFKGKRKVDFADVVRRKLYNANYSNWDYAGHHFKEMIVKSLIKDKKLVKPKKKDFVLKKPNKDFHLYDDDLRVSFDNKKRTIQYITDDNNRSIDRAEDSILGKTTLRLLSRVSYTSRTGGELYSMTEYDTDDGRGESVSRRFK